MKEGPILFTTANAVAILGDRKTQTRRMMKPQPPTLPVVNTLGEWWARVNESSEYILPYRCPYGQPGDRLWVREAWRGSLAYDLAKPSDIPPGSPVVYQANGTGSLPHFNAGKLRPSIFMPRWASRITLEVMDVRVERLQDISEEDAHQEGIDNVLCAEAVGKSPLKMGMATQCGFAYLWEKINGAGSWAANSWVWVISFKRIVA